MDRAIISNIVGNVRSPRQLGNGEGGTIRIDTGSLSMTNGGQLQASTFGRGNAGDIIINARNTVSFSGLRLGDFISPSAAFSIVAPNSEGNGGNIRISTGSLSIADGARLSVSTFGQGRAGNISIDARDAVFLDGVTSGLFANTTRNASGQGGNIQINAGELNVSDRAQMSVNSQGSGVAGDININADTLQLSDHASIIAETASQDGGSISIENADLVLLRRGSLISATAAEGGNGGNITVNANNGFLVAVPSENSDIRANAFQGRGGNVQISTQGIFGIQSRGQDTPFSDITASSQLGVQGQLDITQPDVQPTQGLVELPTQILDASNQIAQTCPRSPNARPLGEFIVTGRGSLPPNPIEPLAGTPNLSPLATLDQTRASTLPLLSPTPETTPSTSPPAIVEATGWIKDSNGNITLVAHAPEVTPSTRPAATACPVSRQ